MTHIAVLPLLLPLVAGFLVLFAKSGGIQFQRVANIVAVLASVLLSYLLLQESLSGGRQVYLLGNWPAPFGIVLVLDQLSALMVSITSVVALLSLIYAVATDTDKQGSHFHVLFQFILFGLNGAFLTGDLFNLFVFFEVLLLASYGLLLHGGGKERTKAGLHYVIINLVGATLFLLAVGTLYGVLGTLNIADMSAKVALLPDEDTGLVAAAGLLLLVVFGIKAALFPLYLWLPIAYTNTSAAVAALFAIMTKVGIYAIIRVHGTVFGLEAGALAHFHLPLILILGMLTLLLASFGVVSARGLREQAAYLVLASVATLLIAVGLGSSQGLSAAIYYLIHSTLIAAGMFLLVDIIARSRRTLGDRFGLTQAIPNAVLIGSMFMFAAVAMTGLPPLSGFFGKLLILSASLDHLWSSVILVIVLLSGFIMIVSMARTGTHLFYEVLPENKNNSEPEKKPNATSCAPNRASIIVVMLFFLSSPLLVIFAGAVTEFAESVAKQQLNTKGYIEAVLSKQVVPSEDK